MPQLNDGMQMVQTMALEFIEVGENEDGEPVILLTGSREAVQAAGRLYGEPVFLVPANFFAEGLELSCPEGGGS